MPAAHLRAVLGLRKLSREEYSVFAFLFLENHGPFPIVRKRKQGLTTTPRKRKILRAQRLINLEIPVLVRSLKSSNVELGYYLDGTLFKCCLSAAAANP